MSLTRDQPTEPGPGRAPAVDVTVLESLIERLGDRGPAFRTTLVTTWRHEAALRLTEMDEAAAASDSESMARGAHALKSGSAALGALGLARLCDEIENRLRAGDRRDLRADAAALRVHVERASAEFTAAFG